MRSLIPWHRESPSGSGGLIPFGFEGDMDRVLQSFFGKPFGLGSASAVATHLDVSENEDEIVVTAEVPGVEPKELEISIHGDVLTLSGEKRQEEKKEEGGTFYSERRYGAFRREIQLSSPVDVEQVTAEHKNGVVTIRLPRAESNRPRRIEIRTE